ncbi:hypothetical protein ACVWZW_004761 [Bradyrhizobium sp. F1.13.4]
MYTILRINCVCRAALQLLPIRTDHDFDRVALTTFPRRFNLPAGAPHKKLAVPSEAAIPAKPEIYDWPEEA